MKRNLIHRITFSGLLIALTIIATRFLSIQNIPIIPFVRISLGPAFIVFSSLYLGPFFGAIVGGASDILGIVLFPNQLGYSINPLFTIVYALLGVVPWLVFYVVKKIKNQNITLTILLALFAALFVFASIFIFTNTTFTFIGSKTLLTLGQKWIIVWIMLSMFAVMIFFIISAKRHFFSKNPDIQGLPYQVAFAVTISELIVMTILNSIVKSLFFEVDFSFVFFASAVVFFINVPLNTFACTYLLVLCRRFRK